MERMDWLKSRAGVSGRPDVTLNCASKAREPHDPLARNSRFQ
jgi:hypothetical protein